MVSCRILCVYLLGLMLVFAGDSRVFAQTDKITGRWQAALASPGGPIKFGLEILTNAGQQTAFLINGAERIEIPTVEKTDDGIRLEHRPLRFRVDHQTGP